MRLTHFGILCLGFVSSLVACEGQAERPANIPVAEFEQEIKAPEVQLLDCRTAGEFQTGHLKNALQADWTNASQFKERVASLDKSKPIYTYCLSGARSGAATEWLRQNGYTAYNLEGGIAAWKRGGKPVDAAKSVPQISATEFLAGLPADRPVLVEVGADWCPPCRKMVPVIDSLQKKSGALFQLVRVDGSEQTGLCQYLAVENFPVFIVYKGQKETWRKQGIVSGEELIKAIQ